MNLGEELSHMYLYYRILQELSFPPHRESLGTPRHPSPGVCRETSQGLKTLLLWLCLTARLQMEVPRRDTPDRLGSQSVLLSPPGQEG